MRRAVSIALQIIGALALLGVATVGVLKLRYELKSDKDKAVFVLNWTGINTSQNWHIISSSVSPRSLTGDHIDYYCIQLERFDVPDPRNLTPWRDGPEGNPLLAEAMRFGVEWAHREAPNCFPTPERANSKDMKIYLWSATFNSRAPMAADVILFEPATNRLFYVGYKV